MTMGGNFWRQRPQLCPRGEVCCPTLVSNKAGMLWTGPNTTYSQPPPSYRLGGWHCTTWAGRSRREQYSNIPSERLLARALETCDWRT